MDMSYFRRARAKGATPELNLLLAVVAARQSATPTAMIFATPESTLENDTLPPEVARFAMADSVYRTKPSADGSFNRFVAQRLLTSGKDL